MTDYKEDQQNEIEALESIYPSEMKILSTDPEYSFTVDIRTEPLKHNSEDFMFVSLKFEYVPTYPDEPPLIEIEDSENLSEEDSTDLLAFLQNRVEDNLGMVMVFTLVSEASEWLNTRLVDSITQKKEAEEQRILKLEEEERIWISPEKKHNFDPERIQDLDRGFCSKIELQSPVKGVSSDVTSEITFTSDVLSDVTLAIESSAGTVPSGITSVASTSTSVSGSCTSGATTSVIRDVAVLGQHNVNEREVTTGLSETKKQTLKKKLAREANNPPHCNVNIEKSDSSTKRFWLGDSTSSPSQHHNKKRRTVTQPVSFADEVRSTKLAIISADYPATKITLHASMRIQEIILKRQDDIPDGDRLPVIIRCVFTQGALMVICRDSFTAAWIEAIFEGLNVGRLILKVINSNELPKSIKVAFKTNDVVTTVPSVFLKRLFRFNPSLKSLDWRFLNVDRNPHSSRWILEVSDEDLKAIAKLNFKASTGLDYGTFKVLSDYNKAPVAENSMETKAVSEDHSQDIASF